MARRRLSERTLTLNSEGGLALGFVNVGGQRGDGFTFRRFAGWPGSPDRGQS